MKKTNVPEKLPMSFADIKTSFVTAKSREQQIKILADLNATTVDVIRDVLVKKCGIDGRSLPRKQTQVKKPAPKAEKPAPKAEAAPAPKEKTERELLAEAAEKMTKEVTDLRETLRRMSRRERQLTGALEYLDCVIRELDNEHTNKDLVAGY